MDWQLFEERLKCLVPSTVECLPNYHITAIYILNEVRTHTKATWLGAGTRDTARSVCRARLGVPNIFSNFSLA